MKPLVEQHRKCSCGTIDKVPNGYFIGGKWKCNKCIENKKGG